METKQRKIAIASSKRIETNNIKSTNLFIIFLTIRIQLQRVKGSFYVQFIFEPLTIKQHLFNIPSLVVCDRYIDVRKHF